MMDEDAIRRSLDLDPSFRGQIAHLLAELMKREDRFSRMPRWQMEYVLNRLREAIQETMAVSDRR